MMRFPIMKTQRDNFLLIINSLDCNINKPVYSVIKKLTIYETKITTKRNGNCHLRYHIEPLEFFKSTEQRMHSGNSHCYFINGRRRHWNFSDQLVFVVYNKVRQKRLLAQPLLWVIH